MSGGIIIDQPWFMIPETGLSAGKLSLIPQLMIGRSRNGCDNSIERRLSSIINRCYVLYKKIMSFLSYIYLNRDDSI